MFSAENGHEEAGAGGDPEGAGAGGNPGRTPVAGADGWSYLPFEHSEETDEHRITLERDDGLRVAMTLPAFVEQGDELREIALQVIRARERWRELKAWAPSASVREGPHQARLLDHVVLDLVDQRPAVKAWLEVEVLVQGIDPEVVMVGAVTGRRRRAVEPGVAH
jgi:hypothetical protein